MRVLCVTDEFPWPHVNGLRIRISNVVTALSALGKVDLFCAVTDDRPPGSYTVPEGQEVGRIEVVKLERRPTSPMLVARMIASRFPRSLARHDWQPARQAMRRFAPEDYDLVWFAHPEPWVALHDLVGGRGVVVDLDNLYDQWLRARRKLWSGAEKAGAGRTARAGVAWLFDRLDERRWRHVYARVGAAADAVVVCSDLDRERLRKARAFVLPNGYEPDGTVDALSEPAPGRQTGPASGPLLTMVGMLGYPPNLDAAAVAARAILPRVRSRHPDTHLRLIGRHDERALALLEEPGVELLGEVPDLSAALSGTDIVVVPVRFGSGTRIKVLEAFARRLPVVSTTLGCEGLGVKDGEHLLVADNPERFAEACLRLLDDARLRGRLVDAAYALWSDCFRSSRLRGVVLDIARRAMDSPLSEHR